MEELECVELARDLPSYRLRAGVGGTIVYVHRGGVAYEVEFFSAKGDTLAVVTCEPEWLRARTPEPTRGRAATA